MVGLPTVVYATWNPADKDADATLSGGNLTSAHSAAGAVRATVGKTTGKWYWEAKWTAGSNAAIGVGDSDTSLATYLGSTIDGIGYHSGGAGQIIRYGSIQAAVTPYVLNDVIGIALDCGASTVTFYRNNVIQYTYSYSGVLVGAIYPMASGVNTGTHQSNFGATALTYSPPSGYNPGLYA